MTRNAGKMLGSGSCEFPEDAGGGREAGPGVEMTKEMAEAAEGARARRALCTTLRV